jgi:hypothetical protein
LTTDLKHVYERQRAAEHARWDVTETYERVYWDLDPRARERVNVHEHPDVRLAQAKADALTAEVAALRALCGGNVFRVVDSKLGELGERIAKLNKKAVKLGTEPVVLTVSDEHHQEVRTESLVDQETMDIYGAVEGSTTVKRVIDYTFVTVNGDTPMIAGWVFVATLDHEADQGADESVGIRRAPTGIHLINRIGEDAAAAVENADLTAYRHAAADCDHCGFSRRRKQTYVLYEVETGELRQIGSTCLKDYTGAHNPERIAAWAEWLEGLYRDLGTEGEGFSEGGGRVAFRTLDFLSNVAAVMRENGWSPRWFKDGYGGFERNHGATADVAMGNLTERNKKHRIEVTDADRAEAETALEWVRELDESDEELDEFQHNLTTYCRADYLPEKGDGFVAYAIMARRRAVEDELKVERAAKVAVESEWIGEVKERLRGLRFHVTFTREFPGDYGTRLLTKGHDDDGNLLVWWSSSEWLEQGHTYELTGTVKRHSTDDYQGGAKVTEITRVAAKSIVDVTEKEEATA